MLGASIAKLEALREQVSINSTSEEVVGPLPLKRASGVTIQFPLIRLPKKLLGVSATILLIGSTGVSINSTSEEVVGESHGAEY